MLRFQVRSCQILKSRQAKVFVRGEQTTQKLWCKVFFTPGVMHVRRSNEQLFVQFVVLQLCFFPPIDAGVRPRSAVFQNLRGVYQAGPVQQRLWRPQTRRETLV
jgi:hypothetical protein